MYYLTVLLEVYRTVLDVLVIFYAPCCGTFVRADVVAVDPEGTVYILPCYCDLVFVFMSFFQTESKPLHTKFLPLHHKVLLPVIPFLLHKNTGKLISIDIELFLSEAPIHNLPLLGLLMQYISLLDRRPTAPKNTTNQNQKYQYGYNHNNSRTFSCVVCDLAITDGTTTLKG